MTLSVGMQFQLSSSSATVPGNDIVIIGTDHFTIYWTSKQSFPVGDLVSKSIEYSIAELDLLIWEF
jgi:hypothetical protein